VSGSPPAEQDEEIDQKGRGDLGPGHTDEEATLLHETRKRRRDRDERSCRPELLKRNQE